MNGKGRIKADLALLQSHTHKIAILLEIDYICR